MLGYKFRVNIDIRQDTFSLLENKFYASKLSQLRDEHACKPSNITIVDDINAIELLDSKKIRIKINSKKIFGRPLDCIFII